MKKKLAILLIVAMIFNTSGTITLADAFNNVAPTETKETDKFFDGLAEEESLSLDGETTENTEEPENDMEKCLQEFKL